MMTEPANGHFLGISRDKHTEHLLADSLVHACK